MFWLIEVTEPDLYVGNKSKVVDILIDTSFQTEDPLKDKNQSAGVILMRFPGHLLVPDQASPFAPEMPYRIDSSLAVKGHMPLLSVDRGRSTESVW